MLSRRSLLTGLLFCLPLFGVKNKKKLYVKFKKSDGYNCIDPKTKYKSSFKVTPDWEYELVDIHTSVPKIGEVFTYYITMLSNDNKEVLFVINNYDIVFLGLDFEVVEK